MFAFTSFNFTPDTRLEDSGARGGLRTFTIHGEIFHQIGGVRREGAAPSYAQLYFLDTDEANNLRIAQSNLNSQIIRELTRVVEQHNQFIPHYRFAYELLHQSNQGAQQVVLNPNYQLVLQSGTDRRRYNLPTTDEVGVVIPDEVNSDNRDIVLFARNDDGSLTSRFHYIHRGHPAYLPLHYVLFYPYGNPGYHWSIPLAARSHRVRGNQFEGDDEQPEENRGGCVSARQYYRYHLFSRQESHTSPIEFNAIIHGERLFQQLCCDMYACVDDSVLNWHRNNQTVIRSDLYRGLIDALRTDQFDGNHGLPVILSSSYHGGDRHMTQCYQVCTYHSITLFSYPYLLQP